MEKRLMDLSFEQWLDYVFNHPVTKPAWYWKKGDYWWSEKRKPAVTISYLTRAFENPTKAFSQYSNAQLNQGLWYLVSVNCSDYMFMLYDTNVPIVDRQRAIRAIYTLFEQLFFPRCSQNLRHLDEHDQGTSNPLDVVCYMWWDLFPTNGATTGPYSKILAQEIFDVITQTLDLESDACRESALHGLGHWHLYEPRRVESIIDRFFAKRPKIRPELKSYARRARKGSVL